MNEKDEESPAKRRRLDKKRNAALLYVQEKGAKLREVAEKYRDDKEIVLAAIGRNSWNVRDASTRLQNDQVVILKAIEKNACGFNSASAALKEDPNFVSLLVKKRGDTLRFASKTLRADRDIVSSAVKRTGYALRYASESLRADRDVVSSAVQQNGIALQFASTELKSDRDIVSLACARNGSALAFASQELRADREIVMVAVKGARPFPSTVYKSTSAMFRQTRNCLGTREDSPLRHASEQLRGDRQIVMEAVKKHAFALLFAKEIFYADKEIVMEAVKNHGDVLERAATPLKDNPEIVGTALATSCSFAALVHMGKNLRERLIALVQRLERLNANISKIFCAREGERGADGIRYADRVWKHGAFETLWLLKQVLPPTLTPCDGPVKTIFEFTGIIEDDIKPANKMISLATVLHGLADTGENLEGIAKALIDAGSHAARLGSH